MTRNDSVDLLTHIESLKKPDLTRLSSLSFPSASFPLPPMSDENDPPGSPVTALKLGNRKRP